MSTQLAAILGRDGWTGAAQPVVMYAITRPISAAGRSGARYLIPAAYTQRAVRLRRRFIDFGCVVGPTRNSDTVKLLEVRVSKGNLTFEC